MLLPVCRSFTGLIPANPYNSLGGAHGASLHDVLIPCAAVHKLSIPPFLYNLADLAKCIGMCCLVRRRWPGRTMR